MGIPAYTVSDIPQALQAIQNVRYAIAATFALQLYEWFSGLEKEIRLIHRSPWTYIKALYLFCRYYPLFMWLLVMWAYIGNHGMETCRKVTHPVHALFAPCQFISQGVMAMRAYASAGRKFRIQILLGGCYLCLVAVDIWVFCGPMELLPELYYILLGDSGCFPNYGGGYMALRLGYAMLAAILMDLTSLLVLVFYCRRTGYHTVSLGRYFISQGVSSFTFLCITNVAAAVAFFRPPRYHDGIGLPMVMVLSNVVACKVILQLRGRVNPTATQLAHQHSGLVRNALRSSVGILSNDVWRIDDDLRHGDAV